MPGYLNMVLRYGAQTGLIYLLLKYFPGNQMRHINLLLMTFVLLVASVVVELSLSNTVEGFSEEVASEPITSSLVKLIYNPANRTMQVENLGETKLSDEHINLVKKVAEQQIVSTPNDRHVFEMNVDTSGERPKVTIVKSESTMKKPFVGEIQPVKDNIVQPNSQQVREEKPVENVQQMRQEVSLPTTTKVVQEQADGGPKRGPLQPAQTVEVDGGIVVDVQNGDPTVDQATGSQPRTILNMDPYENEPHIYPVPNQTSVRSEYLQNKDAVYENHIKQLEQQKNISTKMYVTKEQVGSRAHDGVLQNEMMFTDYNTLQVPQNYPYSEDDYGWNFLPPKDWYPKPPNPPICVSEKQCPVCPVYTNGTNIDLKMWNQARRITPPDRINTDYVKMKLNSGK